CGCPDYPAEHDFGRDDGCPATHSYGCHHRTFVTTDYGHARFSNYADHIHLLGWDCALYDLESRWRTASWNHALQPNPERHANPVRNLQLQHALHGHQWRAKCANPLLMGSQCSCRADDSN